MLSAPAVEEASALHAETARELFDRHRRRVYAYCRSRTRNATDAEDATQTTFMYALSGLRRGVVPEFELAWLLKIAENVCHSMRRRAYRRYERGELPADLLGDANRDPAVVVDRLATIAGALDALPESQRRAILLREWRGLSYEDIADQLGTSHAAVETLLFRARRTLARHAAVVSTAALELARLGRWLLGPGAAKATAVTATALALGTAVPSDLPTELEEAPARETGRPAATDGPGVNRPLPPASTPPETVRPQRPPSRQGTPARRPTAAPAGARAPAAPSQAIETPPPPAEPAPQAPPLDAAARAPAPAVPVEVPTVPKPPFAVPAPEPGVGGTRLPQPIAEALPPAVGTVAETALAVPAIPATPELVPALAAAPPPLPPEAPVPALP